MKLNSTLLGLPPPLVFSLQEIGCGTASDFLQCSSETLILRLPPGTISIRGLEEYKTRVIEALSTVGTTAQTLLASPPPGDPENNSRSLLLTGCMRLDKLLHGFSGANVLEISGDKGSGKSTFIINIILRHLEANAESRVLWIDTTGDFIPALAVRILSQLGQTPGREPALCLDRLELAQAFHLEAVYDVLENSATTQQLPISCIVVDTVTSLLSPALSAVSAQGHLIMTNFMADLRSFGKKYGSTIFVVNNSVATHRAQPNLEAVLTTPRKPALGPTFTFLTDATIWITREPHDEEGRILHTAQVWRSKLTVSPFRSSQRYS
ncbi:hypothetical protein ONZ45_g8659 [Pleurotus djamor]|nr:hypothetical protein ONZ45_g8659 [Pleurotus djamor]